MDAIQVGELHAQLRHLTGAHLSSERMMGRLIEERNEAWHREDEARARTDELEFYVEDIEEYNNLHEELHVIQNHMHPYDNPAGAAKMDARVVLADGDEPDEEN
jgi:hypothetical protein